MTMTAPDPDPLVEEPAGTDAGGTDAAGTTPAAPPQRRWLLPLLALLTAAAVTGAVLTGLAVREERAADDADREALEAGRAAAVAFTSYDHRRLDEDLDQVAGMSTGTFREQFTAALGALTEAITEAKGVSTGEVTHAGLVRRDDDTAVVVAAVDAAVTNASTPEPSTRRYRLQITLNRDSGSWLIADIAPVA